MDPRDGQLYAASHFGVFRVDDGAATQVADRWQDTMAFTVTSDGTFLGRGHPDLREDLPPHVGLIESTDAAQTWSSISLAGEEDSTHWRSPDPTSSGTTPSQVVSW